MPDQRFCRDAALRAILVARANASRTTHRKPLHGPRKTAARRRTPMLVTVVVLVGVIALSAVAIAAGQARITAASRPVTGSTPAGSGTASSTAASTPAASLIAMDGARTLTREQLHAWTLAQSGSSRNANIGEEQDWLTIQCMAEHGYLYDPTFEGSQGLEAGETWGLTPTQLQRYRAALWGTNPNSTKPYDWRDAGCHGRAVHLTGQDDDH